MERFRVCNLCFFLSSFYSLGHPDCARNSIYQLTIRKEDQSLNNLRGQVMKSSL